MSSSPNFEIKIVFDNNCLEGFESGHGFGAIILNNHSKNAILFDTGADYTKLAHNIEKFGIKYESIKKVIITHDHFDHSGGLLKFLEKNSDVEVFVADSNKDKYTKLVPPGVNVIGVKKMIEMEKNLYLSDEFASEPKPRKDPIPEIGLFIKTEDGVVVITGCAHPELELFLEGAKTLGKIKAVIGGFHFFKNFDALEGIEILAPCHCTMKTKNIIERFPDNYVEIKAGSILSF